MEKLINISFIICVFLAMEGISFSHFDFHPYYIFIVLCFPLLIYKHRTIDKSFLVVMASLVFIGTANLLVNNNTTQSLVKNIFGILISYWFYYLVIKENNFDIRKLFILYYKSCVVIAIIGLIQFISYLVGFEYGYDLRWMGFRLMQASDLGGNEFYPIHSITGEPSSFALLLSPAFYIAVNRILTSKTSYGSRTDAYIILCAYPLSQSSTGYFAIFISIILISLNKFNIKRVLLALISIPLSLGILYTISPKFQDRLISSFQLFTGTLLIDSEESNNSNGSALILFNHFLIACKNASTHPFGTGVGSHHIAFEKYNTLKTWFTGYGSNSMLLNIHDASSLFNRILSEMGFIGIMLSAWFLVKNFLNNKYSNQDQLLINRSSIVIILTALLRSGHYFVYGLPFFIFCYYYSYVIGKSKYNINEQSY